MNEIIEEVFEKDEKVNNISHKKLIVALFVLVIFFIISFFVFYLAEKNKSNKIAERDSAYYESLLQKDKAYYESLLQNKPSALQNSFAEDIKGGINDADTKSSAYFITHRFFDNGGDVYEIYDYVESHPELSFLKEAENIYPEVFKELKDKTLSTKFSYEPYYVYLAYVEILYKYGYTDIAGLGTVANQYAAIAYKKMSLAKEMPANEGALYSKYTERDIKKSLEFLGLTNNDVEKILKGEITSVDMPARDILVGLNQYASALRYLEALGVNTTPPKTSREIFAFAMDYSSHFVIELNIFTSLINASTLAILNSSTSDEIKVALSPILSFDTKKPNSYKGSVIRKIINSRLEEKPAKISDTKTSFYSKRNAQLLASKVPDFKVWLMSNGWVESDFK